jgi:hypothetical protein
MIDSRYAASEVKFFMNVKKYSNVANSFFLNGKKIKSCDGLLDVTWLTLLVPKQHMQPVKINFD